MIVHGHGGTLKSTIDKGRQALAREVQVDSETRNTHISKRDHHLLGIGIHYEAWVVGSDLGIGEVFVATVK